MLAIIIKSSGKMHEFLLSNRKIYEGCHDPIVSNKLVHDNNIIYQKKYIRDII